MAIEVGHVDKVGSPPRGRGRPATAYSSLSCIGLTPARAGTALPWRMMRPCRWAHPRAGGDGTVADSSLRRVSGSPPRGRGRRRGRLADPEAMGLTPARAGTAPALQRRSGCCRAHPRAGGDGSDRVLLILRARGSPPRGRGRQSSTVPSGSGPGSPPRGRGRQSSTVPSGSGPGSPPRGRGRLEPQGSDGEAVGLTPARAGTAFFRCSPGGSCRAHPRAGGDGSDFVQRLGISFSSPPRGRGRLVPARVDDPETGLTPARAGTARPAAQEA